MKAVYFSFLFCLLYFVSGITNVANAQNEPDTIPEAYKILFQQYRNNIPAKEHISKFNIAYKKALTENNYKYLLFILDWKAKFYNQQNQVDSTISLTKKQIALSLKKKDTLGTLKAYRSLGYYYSSYDSILPALVAYEKELEVATILNDTKARLGCLYRIEDLQYMMGLWYEAETTAIKSLRIGEDNLKDSPEKNLYISISYAQLGILYKGRKQYDMAIDYYQKCYDLKKEIPEKINYLNNIANIYIETGRYKEALRNFEICYENSVEINDSAKIARSITNLGIAKYKLHHPDALSFLLKGLEMRTNQKNNLGIYSSNLHLGEYYQYNNQPKKAVPYAEAAYKIAKNLSLGEEQIESMELLINLGQSQYNIRYIRFRDSLENIANINAQKYMGFKYNYEKEHSTAEENKVKYLQSNLARQQESQQRKFWQWFTLVGLIFTGALIWVLRTQYKKSELKKIYETESRIAKQVHDEIANDIYHTMNKLQQEGVEGETVIHDLDNIYKRTRNISKANSTIDTENFEEALEDLMIPYQKEHLLLITTGLSNVNWNAITAEKKMALYRVLQELLTNMNKHSQATRVKLTFTENGKHLNVNYTDNGVGTDLKTKNGLKHTENRIHAVGGKITFESATNAGFKAHITL